MRVEGVHHVQVAAPPGLLDATVAFYRDVLGLVPLPKLEGAGSPLGAWFLAGAIEVHVGVQERAFVPATKAHVAFVVVDLDAAITALRDVDAPVEPGAPMPGWRRAFTKDPSGNRVELMEATSTRPRDEDSEGARFMAAVAEGLADVAARRSAREPRSSGAGRSA